jgi:hypothetical protein
MTSLGVCLVELPEDALREILSHISPLDLIRHVALTSKDFHRLCPILFSFTSLKFNTKIFWPGFTLPLRKQISKYSSLSIFANAMFWDLPLIRAIDKSSVLKLSLNIKDLSELSVYQDPWVPQLSVPRRLRPFSLEEVDLFISHFPNLRSLQILHPSLKIISNESNSSNDNSKINPWGNLVKLQSLDITFSDFMFPEKFALDCLTFLGVLQLGRNEVWLSSNNGIECLTRLKGISLKITDTTEVVLLETVLARLNRNLKFLSLKIDSSLAEFVSSRSISLDFPYLDKLVFLSPKFDAVEIPTLNSLRVLRFCDETYDIFVRLSDSIVENLFEIDVIFRGMGEYIYKVVEKMKLCKKLEILKMMLTDLPLFDDAELFHFLSELPHLRCLTIKLMTNDGLTSFLESVSNSKIVFLHLELGSSHDSDIFGSVVRLFPNLKSLILLMPGVEYGNFTLPPLLQLANLTELGLCSPKQNSMAKFDSCFAYVPNIERMTKFVTQLFSLRKLIVYLDHGKAMENWREYLLPKCPQIDEFVVSENYRFDSSMYDW